MTEGRFSTPRDKTIAGVEKSSGLQALNSRSVSFRQMPKLNHERETNLPSFGFHLSHPIIAVLNWAVLYGEVTDTGCSDLVHCGFIKVRKSSIILRDRISFFFFSPHAP